MHGTVRARMHARDDKKACNATQWVTMARAAWIEVLVSIGRIETIHKTHKRDMPTG
jgi:hypothetical protein